MESPPALAAPLPSLQWLGAWCDARGEGLLVKDAASGRCVYANASMQGVLGVDPATVIGRLESELHEPVFASALRAADHAAREAGRPTTCEHVFERVGERFAFSVTRCLASGEPDAAPLIVSSWRDLAPERRREQRLKTALEQIEQQQRANDLLRRQLSDQTLRDPASGLHRQAHFEDQLRREIDLSQREHREFAVVCIEIDPPAAPVLALGNTGSQAVLEAMGRLLRGGTRAMDASCRIEGQRFAVLLSGVGLATAHARMEGLRRTCATQIVVHEGHEFGFTVAMGVASFPHTAQTREDLLQACEAALAEARRRGGNHVALAAIRFDPA